MRVWTCALVVLTSQLVAGAVPVMVEASSKVLFSPEELPIDAETMTFERYNAMLNAAAQTAGISFSALPSVVMPQGIPGRVEVGERKGNGNAPGVGNPMPPFVGWIVNYETDRAGPKVRLNARVRFGFVPGKNPPNVRPRAEPDKWEKVVTKEGASEAVLSAKEIVVTLLGEVQPGWHAYCFTTVTPTGPNGGKFDDFAAEYPDPDAAPPIAVRYRVHATLVEGLGVPRLADSPLHPPRFYGFHDAESMLGALEGWKRDPKLRVRDLAPVNLPAGKIREAWAAFPGFRVAFQPSGKPEIVELSYELPRSPQPDGGVVVPLPPQRRHTITVDGENHLTFLLAGEDEEKPRRLFLSVDRIE